MSRCLPALLTGVLALVGTASTATASTPRPVITHPKATEVLEGDVLRISARIPAPRAAKKATLERLTVPPYFGSPTWEPVKSVAVRGRARVRFDVTAEQENVEKLRVRVEMKSGRSKASKAVKVKIWRWVPLDGFQAYQATSFTGTGEASIAGRRMPAWGAQYTIAASSWESRYTPGRNCKAFRGIAGLSDTSADGATGAVAVSADEQLLWSSTVLTPGATQAFEIAMDRPYRVALTATNTVAPDVKSFPLIGDPQLLCSGL